MEISTWRTDAGDLDVLTDIPDRDGRHMRYAELIGRASELQLDGMVVRVAALEDVTSKEWANRPKDRTPFPSFARFEASSHGPRPRARGDKRR
jgi:hypothetical protein